MFDIASKNESHAPQPLRPELLKVTRVFESQVFLLVSIVTTRRSNKHHNTYIIVSTY